MAESPSKLTVKSESKAPAQPHREWRPFDNLRQEVDRLLEEFDRGVLMSPFRHAPFDLTPFWRRETSWGNAPAVDIAEKPESFELTAEMPGMEEKNLEVKIEDGALVLKGEKQEEKEEKKKDYYLQERHFGSFERRFAVPENVDAEKIQATFKNGVLTVVLPKKAESKKPEKKIEVKAA